MQDGSHHVIDKITKRISDSVGLNSQPSNVGSEHYQVDLSLSLSSHRISFRVCVYGLHVHWNFIILFRDRWPITASVEDILRTVIMAFFSNLEANPLSLS